MFEADFNIQIQALTFPCRSYHYRDDAADISLMRDITWLKALVYHFS